MFLETIVSIFGLFAAVAGFFYYFFMPACCFIVIKELKKRHSYLDQLQDEKVPKVAIAEVGSLRDEVVMPI